MYARDRALASRFCVFCGKFNWQLNRGDYMSSKAALLRVLIHTVSSMQLFGPVELQLYSYMYSTAVQLGLKQLYSTCTVD